MSIELDELDKLAASVFDGYLVRKDLVRKYSRRYPVPSYVVWFLHGRLVNKTVSGLTKLLFPDSEMPVPDEDLEWIVRVALESRRRVKEQQRRVFKSEFRCPLRQCSVR